MVKIRDFELSFYKFVKEQYADAHNYPVYYGDISVDVDKDDIWLYCNFFEINIDTGRFSQVSIDVRTRIFAVDSYNSQLTSIIDDLRQIFINADISLFDFSDINAPASFDKRKILVRDSGRPVYERVIGVESAGLNTLIQASQMTLKAKLLENFARKRIVT